MVTILLAEHEAALAVMTNREVRAMLRALADSESEVLAALASEPDLLRRQRLAALVTRLAGYRVTMEARLRNVLDAADRRVLDLAARHLDALAAAAGPAALSDAGRVQAAGVLARQHDLLLHQYSVGRYSQAAMGRIQTALVAGVLQGESPGAVAARVRRAGGPAALNRREAELMARMELSRAYSQGNGEIAAVLYDTDPGWRKRIVEVRDRNNHPFSRVADGTLAKPGAAFAVSVAAVAAAAAAMGRSAKGVVWAARNGAYRGMHLPAHFGERGRVVPWHVAWGP